MATDALYRHCVLPETLQHPVVVSEAIELAYLLTAYGLVPTKPRPDELAAAWDTGGRVYPRRQPIYAAARDTADAMQPVPV